MASRSASKAGSWKRPLKRSRNGERVSGAGACPVRILVMGFPGWPVRPRWPGSAIRGESCRKPLRQGGLRLQFAEPHPVAGIDGMQAFCSVQFRPLDERVVSGVAQEIHERGTLARRRFAHGVVQSTRAPCHQPAHGRKKSGALHTLPAGISTIRSTVDAHGAPAQPQTSRRRQAVPAPTSTTMALQRWTCATSARAVSVMGLRWNRTRASGRLHAIDLNCPARDVASVIGDRHRRRAV